MGQKKTFELIHRQACLDGQDSYRDPDTGNSVFTALYLKKRGYCCESGCRHCPYKITVSS